MQRYFRWANICVVLACACSALILAVRWPSAPAGGAAGTFPSVAATQPRRTLDTLDIRVDPRVELISIVCRLAGHPEYNRARINAYTRDVDEYFLPHRTHAAVKRMRELGSQYGVSFDAPMSMAVHLSGTDSLRLLVPLEPWPEDLDQRWRKADLPAFLDQLRDFTGQTHFADFLEARQDLFNKAVAKTKAALAGQGHLEWFDGFFGKASPVRYHVVLGMLTGGSSYGVRIVAKQQDNAYSILGTWNTGNDGVPRFDANTIWVLVHEFGHSYVNPIVIRHLAEFQPAGVRIYAIDPDRMQKQNYGHWTSVMFESVLRACVIRYLQSNDSSAVQKQADYEAKCGFTWVPELANLLGDYEQHRDHYPVFEDFIPRIVKYFDEYVSRHETH